MPIIAAANIALHSFMPAYFTHAAHRQATALEVSASARPLHFFRGMVHFEPSEPFLNTLRRAELNPLIFRYPNGGEFDRLRQWPRNTHDAVVHYLAQPESLGTNPIFAGHSAGGFTVYALAALSRGGDITALQKHIPGLDDIPVQDLEDLAGKLSTALFLGIASPLNGIRFKRTERFIHRAVLQWKRPHLTRALCHSFLNRVYRDVGLHPEHVVDGILISGAAPFQATQSRFNRGLNSIVQGGMRLLRGALIHAEGPAHLAHLIRGHDAIVPYYAAALTEPLRRELAMNHTQIVEEPAAARALAELIRELSSPQEQAA